MASISTQISYQQDAKRAAARFDWPLLGAAVLLMIFGLMSLYSLSQSSVHPTDHFKKQLLYIVIGLLPFGIFVGVAPQVWRRGAFWLYAFNVLILLAVLVIGKHINGSERWIMLPGGVEFQPSELAKLLTILTLATFYANRQDSIHKPATLLLGFLHIAIPCFLIKIQPHTGAAMVVFAMWLAVSVIAGIPAKHLIGLLVVLAALGLVGMSIPSIRGKMIQKYQDQRMTAMANAGKDSKKKLDQSVNYQTDRAEIAFGVGGVSGAGFLHGEQKAAGFIPEQNNDFIVTVVGEEGGLIGCTLLLAAYGFFFYRIFLVMLYAVEPYYRMIAAGIFAVLGFHMFVNIAMVLKLIPVIGLWLPFMSQGGTAMWLCMACVGLLLGIRRRQRPILF